MQTCIFKDYQSLSIKVVQEIAQLVITKPDAVICLPSGETPRLTCTLLVEKAHAEKIDFSRVTFFGLDEWIGIPPQNEGSGNYFFYSTVFAPLKIAPAKIHLFDGMADDLSNECRKMDLAIAAAGGIDLMLVGIGMNGHIGFNEPGTSPNYYSHVIDLDKITTSVGQKYFKQATVLGKGITLGLKHLLESKRVLVIANGIKKANIIKKMMEEEISEMLPASIVRKHFNAALMIDEEVASLLKK